MERVRKEVLLNALKRIEGLLGKPAGSLRLDYAACYGGYNVEEACNPHGGVTHPFGDRRVSSGEMWIVLNAVERALEIKIREGKP